VEEVGEVKKMCMPDWTPKEPVWNVIVSKESYFFWDASLIHATGGQQKKERHSSTLPERWPTGRETLQVFFLSQRINLSTVTFKTIPSSG
jgi:hypothetical protein